MVRKKRELSKEKSLRSDEGRVEEVESHRMYRERGKRRERILSRPATTEPVTLEKTLTTLRRTGSSKLEQRR